METNADGPVGAAAAEAVVGGVGHDEGEYRTYDDEQRWCSPRGKKVPVWECHTGCADECQRPVCWGVISPSFEEGA